MTIKKCDNFNRIIIKNLILLNQRYLILVFCQDLHHLFALKRLQTTVQIVRKIQIVRETKSAITGEKYHETQIQKE